MDEGGARVQDEERPGLRPEGHGESGVHPVEWIRPRPDQSHQLRRDHEAQVRQPPPGVRYLLPQSYRILGPPDRDVGSAESDAGNTHHSYSPQQAAPGPKTFRVSRSE